MKSPGSVLVAFLCVFALTTTLVACSKKDGKIDKETEQTGMAGDPRPGKAKEGGGAGGVSGVVSCDLRKEQKKCIEYRGETAAKAAKHTCTVVNRGDLINGPCPTEGWVDKCEQKMAMVADSTEINYDPAESRKSFCEAIKGTYTKK